MTHYAYRYPDGATGFALLFVRAGCALAAFGIAVEPPGGPPGASLLQIAAGLVALSLVLGIAARSLALLLGIAVVAGMTLAAPAPARLLLLAGHVAGCAAIVLAGPGAFSIDAVRHGRRVIHLQTNTPDRGDRD